MRARTKETRGDIRRRQIIAAAADCFRREGFHGSSIARISQAAGMSPGHIYHYFASKELIVEAIVEQEEGDFAELLRLLRDEPEGSDFLDVLSRQVDVFLDRFLDPQRLALMLEIAAEAARNPRIAEMLRESDRRMAGRFAELAAEQGEGVIAKIDDPDSRSRLEMLPVLFSGLALRSIYNPALDRQRMAGLIKEALAHLWTASP